MLEGAQKTGQGLIAKARAVVFQPPLNGTILALVEDPSQIGLGGRRRQLIGLERRTTEGALQPDATLQAEDQIQRFKPRDLGVIRRGEQMILVVEHLLMHRDRKFAEPRPWIEPLAQKAHGHEHAVDRLGAGDVTPGIRVGADQLTLPGQAPDPDQIEREQERREGDASGIGEGLQRAHPFRLEAQREGLIGVWHLGWHARLSIDRQLGMGIGAGELVLPVSDGLGEGRALGQAARPLAIVEDAQTLRHRAALVARTKLLQQQIEGPAVEDRMMDAEQEAGRAGGGGMDFGAPQRGGTDPEHFMAQRLGALAQGLRGAIVERDHRQLDIGGEDLEPLGLLAEAGAKHRMRGEQIRDRGAQAQRVDPVREVDQHDDVIGIVIRQAQRPALDQTDQPIQHRCPQQAGRLQRRQWMLALLRATQHIAEIAKERMLEQLLGANLLIEPFREPQTDLHHQQRMTAKMEEMAARIKRARRDPEHLGPGRPHLTLERILCTADRRDIGLGVWHRQARAINLAADIERKRLQRDQIARHHVVLQLCLQSLTQPIRLECAADVPGDQRCAAMHREGANIDPGNLRLLGDRMFDITEFDAKTAHLDLKITAAEKLQLAIGPEASKVPSKIEPSRAERVGDELALGQLWPPEIAARHRRTADGDLTDAAERRQRPLLIEQIGAVATQRSPQIIRRLLATHAIDGGHHGGLGRAVDVGQIDGLGPEMHRFLISRLAPGEERDQLRQRAARQQPQQRWRQEGMSYLLLPHQLEQGQCIGARGTGHHHELAALRQRIEDLEHAGIEVDRCELHPTRPRAAFPDALERGDEMRQHAALDGDALGRAGGARGIDHIGDAPALRRLGRLRHARRVGQERIDVEHRALHHRRDDRARLGIGDHGAESSIGGDEGEPLGRHARVQGYIASTAREHAEDGLNHALAAPETETDQRVWDVERESIAVIESGGHSASGFSQGLIAQHALAEAQRRCVGGSLRGRKELIQHILCPGSAGFGCIPRRRRRRVQRQILAASRVRPLG